MLQINRAQKGFSAVEVLVVVVVIAIAGSLGYVYVNRQSPVAKINSQATTKTAPATPVTPAAAKAETASIKNELDALDLDQSVDTSTLDEALQ